MNDIDISVEQAVVIAVHHDGSDRRNYFERASFLVPYIG